MNRAFKVIQGHPYCREEVIQIPVYGPKMLVLGFPKKLAFGTRGLGRINLHVHCSVLKFVTCA